MGVVQCWVFITDGVSEKDKPYPSEFSSVSFCYYLKLIIFTVTSKIESMFGGFGLFTEYLGNECKYKQSVR